MNIQIDDEVRAVSFMEDDADLRRMQGRRSSAARRRAARHRAELDDFGDLEGLPMPALTSLRARSEKRDGKFKKRGPTMAQSWREQAKVSLQKTRHLDASHSRNVRQNDLINFTSEQDSIALA